MICHVTLEIARSLSSACASFYAIFGFYEVAAPPDLRERVVWLERERFQVHLLLAEEPHPRGGGHFAVSVPDFDATFEDLRRRGCDPQQRPRYWGSARAYVRDPAGNLVEFMAYPPPVGGVGSENWPTNPISGSSS